MGIMSEKEKGRKEIERDSIRKRLLLWSICGLLICKLISKGHCDSVQRCDPSKAATDKAVRWGLRRS